MSATVTTFDTVDYLDQPLHADITLPVREDGECQAWIKVSQSLPQPLRVRVTIPATPAPVPGTVRITDLVCYKPADETVTIKNLGKQAVSLEGFSLRSDPERYLDPEEYMEPNGILLPGESRTYHTNQWLNITRQDLGVFREDRVFFYFTHGEV